jgi:hypothetical protein
VPQKKGRPRRGAAGAFSLEGVLEEEGYRQDIPSPIKNL